MIENNKHKRSLKRNLNSLGINVSGLIAEYRQLGTECQNQGTVRCFQPLLLDVAICSTVQAMASARCHIHFLFLRMYGSARCTAWTAGP